MSANDFIYSPPECHDVMLSALRQYACDIHGLLASVGVGSYVVVSHGAVFGDYRSYAKPYIEFACDSEAFAFNKSFDFERDDYQYLLNYESPYRYEYEIWHVVSDVDVPLLSDSYIRSMAAFRYFSEVMASHV